MRKLLATLLLLCLLLVPAAALADGEDTLSGEELLYNGDFAEYSESAALPAGWELSAYQSDAESVSAYVLNDDDGQLVITIENLVPNDSRVCQTVAVSPDTVYRLRADVRTTDVENGTGANLSIDNYPIDGTYCYSENLFGTDAWRTVTLYFRTAPEQTSVNVALRLGGYGTTAEGAAEYRNVSLYACAQTSGEIVDLATENGTISGTSGASDAAAAEESTGANGKLILALAATAFLTLGYIWLYRKHLRRQNERLEPAVRPSTALLILLLGAFVLRVFLSLLFYGHPTDINCFMAWGNMVLDGTSKFYTSGSFTDYPPGYMYICGALAWFCRTVGIGYGTDGMALLFKLPATAADLIGTWLLYRLAKKNGAGEKTALLLAGVFALCPVLAFVSGAWGQIDSVLALLLVLTMLLFQDGKRVAAGALYGLAILFKPQALMLGPILAVAYAADILNAKKDWYKRPDRNGARRDRRAGGAVRFRAAVPGYAALVLACGEVRDDRLLLRLRVHRGV